MPRGSVSRGHFGLQSGGPPVGPVQCPSLWQCNVQDDCEPSSPGLQTATITVPSVSAKSSNQVWLPRSKMRCTSVPGGSGHTGGRTVTVLGSNTTGVVVASGADLLQDPIHEDVVQWSTQRRRPPPATRPLWRPTPAKPALTGTFRKSRMASFKVDPSSSLVVKKLWFALMSWLQQAKETGTWSGDANFCNKFRVLVATSCTKVCSPGERLLNCRR
mmetsp:Transcript_78592/g.182363  ORF Transcript_78592/g.182363 Transcript_78592/m.182363 type:complete len:216 (-) Transcript_78592:529-1176(-)